VDEPVEIVHRKTDLNEVRDLCERVADGFKNVAATLNPNGEPRETAARLYVLGKDMQRFGEAYGKFWEGSL
jgi:hypothetical protein